jgi:opine dehydrogenase
MTSVAVLGAGAGGAAAAVQLSLEGHAVRLWNRSEGALEAFRRAGGVRYEGRLGEGVAEPEVLTTDLRAALGGAEVAFVCLPALAHPAIFERLAEAGASVPLVLNPGGVGGSLEAREVFRGRGVLLPPLAELSTLTYVARKYAPETVVVSGVAERVWGAALPGGAEALAAAGELYPSVTLAPDVLFTGLSNVNLVLHPPGAILAAAWIEATLGGFRFYAEGMTSGVARVLEGLDAERLAVGRAFDHDLPSLAAEMAAIGTGDREAAARGDLLETIRGGAANARIPAPGSLEHRYYREDFAFGLLPFTALAAAARVPVPVAASLLRLGTVLRGAELGHGRSAERMGVSGMDVADLLRRVRGEQT